MESGQKPGEGLVLDGLQEGVASSPTTAEWEPYSRVVLIRCDGMSSHTPLPDTGWESDGKVAASVQVPLALGS